MDPGESETPTTYRQIFKVAALYSERSGWWKVKKAYIWETSIERAKVKAGEVLKGAKHILIRKR